MPQINRRLLIGSAAGLALTGSARAQGRGSRQLAVYKSPTCGCCDGWVVHMRQAGFTAAVHVVADPGTVRRARGLPDALASCHTGVIGGYAIEGHVPAADVVRLLAERPEAVGLTVPRMPMGSPGMETPDGRKAPFDTLLVLRSGETRVFARHNRAA
ncbi:DUF411 domain-containing protein [Brevundimonas basaltis]|uniref:DUF411 domain-containing protein n=1 Tax=Brevundimonas basaltis TaxID=472166 RepID=A0A7W8MG97_9CAUL|nr:DUF411 domain-containing protein [Brevundimonas basaltis]MBB5290776.1 hypothetical protein [Brevundimonas basaltis]